MGKTKEHHFLLIGISHKTAPIAIREKLSFSDDMCQAVLRGIHKLPCVKECVVLSTCNRTEMYAVVTDNSNTVKGSIQDFILSITGVNASLSSYLYSKYNSDVIKHLFTVSAGLDSMIVGEPQIFGQVKNAYSLACDVRATGPMMNRLFHHAFRVGKHVRNATAIGEGGVSVGYAAVEMAKEIVGGLSNRSVLLVGAGKMGELCAKHLVDSGIDRLIICNRTSTRAENLVSKLTGEIVPFKNLIHLLKEVDIVITSVSTNEPVIRKDDLIRHRTMKRKSPLLLIDLGVPRNIESAVGEMSGIWLYTIDDLNDVALGNLDRRKSEAKKALSYIEEEVSKFSQWLTERKLVPTIQRLHDRCDTIRRGELEKIRNKVTPDIYETIDLVTRRIVRKILHGHISVLRESTKSASPKTSTKNR